LKATFAGDGPLNQVVLENGAKQSVQENSDITIDDAKGEWDFEYVYLNNTMYEHAHLSVLPPTEEWPYTAVDLHFGHEDPYDGPFYMGDGTMEGNKFTGTYYQQDPYNATEYKN